MMNSVLILEPGEHTVLGRLEGVTACKGLGKAIHWESRLLKGPSEYHSLDEDKEADKASTLEWAGGRAPVAGPSKTKRGI